MTMIELTESTDLDVIRDLSVETFTETFAPTNTAKDLADYIERNYDPETLRREIEDPDSTFIVATVDGEPAGYMKLNVGDAQTEQMLDDRMEVQRLYLLERFRRHGLGTRLMQIAFDHAKAQGKRIVWLGVWEHNEPAKAFYRRMGFAQVGDHAFYMGDDKQTDLIMQAAVE